MKKILSTLIPVLLAIGIHSCSKESTGPTIEHDAPQQVFPTEFESLKSDIQALNQIYITPETKVPRWLRWICVGISDAVGAAVGSSFGGVPGGIAFGVCASIEAYRVFLGNNQLCISEDNGINSIGVAEEEFLSFSIEDDNIGTPLSSGFYHNTIIRNIIDEYGELLYTMSQEQIQTLVLNEINNFEEILSCETNVFSSLELSDYVYDSTIDQSPEMFVERISSLNPSISVELSVLYPILDAIDTIEDENVRVNYVNDVIQLIYGSGITEASMNTLISGTTIALESSLLWNIDTIE